MDSEYKNRNGNSVQIVTEIAARIRSGDFPAGTRLPPEKELVREYGVNVYSIRKAIAVLKEQGLLYSVPKVGVFVVRDIRISGENPPFYFGPDLGKQTLRLATQSNLETQLKFWKSVEKVQPSLSAVSIWDSSADSGISGDTARADIFEYGTFDAAYYRRKDFLNVRKHFSWAFPAGEPMPDEHGIPIYSVPGLLMVNLDMLKKIGVSQEHYRNYEEQNAYLERILSAAERKGLPLPGTSLGIIKSIGRRHLAGMYAMILDPAAKLEDFRKRFSPVIRRATALWRRYRTSYPNIAVPALQDFLAGRTPFFRGSVADFISMKERKPEFPCTASMLFAEDDTYNRILMTLSIHAGTEHPVEAIQLARLLRGPEFQSRFAEMGALPVDPLCWKDYSPESSDLAKNLAAPLVFRSPEEFYVCVNILNVELMRIILGQKEQTAAEYDIFMFSRSYLALREERMTEEEKERSRERERRNAAAV